MGTIGRILTMMKCLCQVRHATIPELAKQFGVSERTIRRDIEELGYFIPLETRAGRYEGGVYVMEDYVWDKAYMSAEDIELLIRIKTIGEKQERLMLDGTSLQRLGRIITTYSMPRAK